MTPGGQYDRDLLMAGMRSCILTLAPRSGDFVKQMAAEHLRVRLGALVEAEDLIL